MNHPIYIFTYDCLRKSTARRSITPFLDSLPIHWSRGYSSGTWTLPAHASLFSGQSPVEHGTTRPQDRLKKESATLPQTAKENGYTTAMFSENPSFSSRTGFGHYVDMADESINSKLFRSDFSPEEYVDELSVGDGLQLVREILSRPGRVRNTVNTAYKAYDRFLSGTPSYPHHGRRLFRHFRSYVDQRSDPVLAVVNVLDPHNPYYGAPPGSESVRSDKEREALRAGAWAQQYMLTREDPPDVIRSVYGDWETFLAAKERIYEQFSGEADRLLSRWQNERSERFNNALVVVVGDHGQLFGTDGMYGHQVSLHPHGVHVPLAVSPPEGWADHERSITTPVSIAGLGRALVDVMDGKVNTTTELVDAVARHSREPNGGVLICADGPTYSVARLYEHDRFDDALVDRLAVRKAAYVHDDHVDLFESPWDENSVTARSYRYTADGRELLPERETPPLPSNIEGWLTRTGDVGSDRWDTITERLEALGYA